MVASLELEAEPQPAAREVSVTDFDGLPNDGMDIEQLAVEVKPAAGDPGDIEQVVDQPGLELHVPLGHVQQ